MPKPYITKGTRVRVHYYQVDTETINDTRMGLRANATGISFTGTVRNIWSDTPDGSGKVTFNVERDDTGICQEVPEGHIVEVMYSNDRYVIPNKDNNDSLS